MTKEGRPLRKRRYLFSESFYTVGMAEYAAATGDRDALEKAEKCFENMLAIYRAPASDPYKITPKSYASTRSEAGGGGAHGADQQRPAAAPLRSG